MLPYALLGVIDEVTLIEHATTLMMVGHSIVEEVDSTMELPLFILTRNKLIVESGQAKKAWVTTNECHDVFNKKVQINPSNKGLV
jgi:hypothetical protein